MDEKEIEVLKDVHTRLDWVYQNLLSGRIKVEVNVCMGLIEKILDKKL